MIATMTKPLAAFLARLKPRVERPTTEQKMDRLIDNINRTPATEQVEREVTRLARLEKKIEQRTARHHQRDLARAEAARRREAADRHPAIVRPSQQWELAERWDGMA